LSFLLIIHVYPDPFCPDSLSTKNVSWRNIAISLVDGRVVRHRLHIKQSHVTLPLS